MPKCFAFSLYILIRNDFSFPIERVWDEVCDYNSMCIVRYTECTHVASIDAFRCRCREGYIEVNRTCFASRYQ